MSDKAISYAQIFWIYLRLGCISFGGPVAHLGYFKDEFVNRRKWLSDERYTELLGLCQFVPGPSSSQLGFAVGWHKGGLIGACVAWLGFTLPSALLMIGFAYGLFIVGDSANAFIGGLLTAAVAVVANAVVGLGKKLCPDIPRILIAVVAAALVLLLPSSLMQIVAILIGAIAGNLLFRKADTQPSQPAAQMSVSKLLVYGSLIAYTLLLCASIFINSSSHGSIYAVHYQAGALVFGGGHVVLPLLQEGMVPHFLNDGNFLAGYSAAQALPGPLFTLSSFLGTASATTNPYWLGGLGALIAIFLPGMLLLIGLLPFWNKLRDRKWAKAGLIGANAAVVGLLLAALINPVWPHGIQTWKHFILAAVAFIALYRFKTPSWLVVLSCGLIGFLIA
ncbi:MAG: chromate efflux transporter [Opitutaceae bacterium]